MRLPKVSLCRGALLFISILALSCGHAAAQTTSIPARITQAVDENNLVVLKGNVHPLARPEFDQGPVADAQPLNRILLLLQRSAAQESALRQLLDDQQSKSSPKYHAWLTPDQFGKQFGPADADIQTITQWLATHGFTGVEVGPGRNLIEFSGDVGQVRNAFHTEIHHYFVNGQEHLANTSDPQIPAALTRVVAGIVSLHNFPRKTQYRRAAVLNWSKDTSRAGLLQLANPDFTYQCGSDPNTGQPIYCSELGPYDFAAIYNVLPLWNATPAIDGTGETIAIANESNIKVQDVRDFRTIFGLPANDPVVVLNGPDPGLVPNIETEADLDVEMSGGVAKGATIKLVVSQATETTAGVDLSAEYVVDNNLAPILSVSFGDCELNLGAAGNQFYNQLWQQAAAQGISVFVSSGDNGAAGCDFFAGQTPQPAQNGLQVSGFASTPYNIAVGGTDFNDFFNFTTYWSTTNNSTTQQSANGYIPETTWNDSCTNAIFGDPRIGFSTNAETNCNNSRLTGFVFTAGGSGGKSSCTTPSGQTPAACAGGYSKPSWQFGTGVPLDGKRDVPDVSLFASNGFVGNSYAICETDVLGFCSSSNLFPIGGTSASAPAFAAIMALVNQKTQSRQGNANVVLYKLATKQSASSCNSSTGPASTCIFNDVTSGTIAMPCAKNSLSCTTSSSIDQYGVLSGYNAGAGYDLATGLGSVNVQNLVNNWSSVNFLPSATTLTASVNGTVVSSITVAHGAPVSVSSNVTAGTGATGTPTGQVALVAAPNPTPGNPSGSLGVEALTLSSGSASGTNVILPGGSYNLTAHYQGDATFGSSDSSPGIPVTITAENSKTLISIPTFDVKTGMEAGNTPSSLVYGSPYIARMDIGNAQATLSFPPKPVCTPPSCPTGTITWTDSLNGAAAAPLDGGMFSLNSEGYTEDQRIQLSGGSHVLTASYSGDNSYSASASTYAITITPAPTTTTEQPLVSNPVEGVPFQVLVGGSAQTQSGAAPTGTIAFLDGTTQLGSPFSVTGFPGQNGSAPGFSLNPNFTNVTIPTAGMHTLTTQYSGDSNYASSVSSPFTLNVLHRTTANISASPTTLNYGSTVTITGVINTTVPASNVALKPTGAVSLYGNADGPITSGLTITTVPDGSGNWEIQVAATVTPSNSESFSITYAGDSNYASVSASSNFVTVVLPDFSMAPNPAYLTITAGQTGSQQLTITPANNLASTVNFSCSPDATIGITCSFSPTSVNLTNSTPTTATVTLGTLPPSATSTAAFPASPGVKWPRWPGGRGWPVGLDLVCLVALLLSFLPRQSRTKRLAFALVAASSLLYVFGCGGSAGGGGGGGGPVPTSVAITVSATKVPAGTSPSVTLSANVTSTRTVAGTITFWEKGNDGALTPPLTVVANSASSQVALPFVGMHQIYAQYSGDSQNQGSQSSTLNVVATGTTYMGVQATNGPVSQSSTIWVTIQ